MADNKGAVIFLAIIAVAGLGLSGYMFTMDLIVDENQGNLKLVALWEQLAQNKDNPSYATDNNFLIEHQNNLVFNPTYVNNISTTRFAFNIPGIYKITLNVLFNSLIAGQTVWIQLRRNGTIIAYVARIDMPSPTSVQFEHIHTTFYINATGDYYYELNPYSGTAFWASGTNPYFNDLSIEYVLS